MNIEQELITRLRNAVDCHCIRTAKARIRGIAEYRYTNYGIDKSETIKMLTQKYLL